MNTKERWIVGIDLRPRSDGAVTLATWLHAQAPEAIELVGIHVAEAGEGEEDGGARVRTATEQAVARARAAFVAVEVVAADDPATALATAQQARAARGLIIGRRANSEDAALNRLGSVARRLLRRLVAPTFVVPPDLALARLGAGPVVVAVTPDEASVGAVKIGQKLSAVLRRPLAFVTVVSTPVDYIAPDRVHPVAEERAAQKMRAADATTSAWLLEQGVHGQVFVRRGDTLSQIEVTATELAAPFVVCGSRLLGIAGRLFGLSVSSELAAVAGLPVLVVPSDAAG